MAIKQQFRIHIAPIPFHWSEQQVVDFHQKLMTYPIHSVTLGEAVCSKRRLVSNDTWTQLAQDFAKREIEVGCASLPMYVAESEQKALTAQLKSQQYQFVEAQDYAALAMAKDAGVAVRACGSLNLYHIDAIKRLSSAGLSHWQNPVEMPADQFYSIARELPTEIKPMLTVWGYQPLAISARCFTARHHDRPKDQCKQICQQDSSGLVVRTQEQQALFTINGVQTLSHQQVNLLADLKQIAEHQCLDIRLIPDSLHFFTVLDFLCDPNADAASPVASLGSNGYWRNVSGITKQDN